MTQRLIVHPDESALAAGIAARLATAMIDAVAARGIAHVALTGGGIGTAALAALAVEPARAAIDWSRVHLWWGDERFEPTGDPLRNETGARDALIDGLAIPATNVHPMPASDVVATPEESASRYAADLADHAAAGAAEPVLDVVLLGIGPDGHVASLFPGHPEVSVTDATVVAVHDSPKPPPVRVSLTMPVIRGARQVWILASGPAKAAALHAAWAAPADASACPASVARGQEASLLLADREAAALLHDPA